MILAGDVGGTKTVLGLFETQGSELLARHERRFECSDYATFETLLEEFLREAGNPAIDSACIGVAGIVQGDRCNATNLPWVVTTAEIARLSGAARVRLLNDLEAAAIGMLSLREDQQCVLQAGIDPTPHGHIAVIAAGTGLGQAVLFFDGQRHHPMPSEGGHAGFAPADALQVELLEHLRSLYGDPISAERVLSGPGYLELYRFLRKKSAQAEPSALAQALQTDDAAAAITRAAQQGSDPVCVQTLEVFTEIYGSEAGNLALRSLPRGGVMIGGGIAPQIVAEMQSGRFIEAFTNKGFLRDFLCGLRVTVVLEATTPLLGSARYAASL